MRTFFISDMHFGHANSIRFDQRPFDTVEEMNEGLIQRWNSVVTREDHVYVLGDFCYKSNLHVKNYTEALHGSIHLIRGNHDKKSEQYESAFTEVSDYKDIVIDAFGNRYRLILSHYFMPFYNGARHMAFHLYGHTHMSQEATIEERIKADLRDKGLRCEAYNVGCMYQDYRPQTFEEIIARQDRKIDLLS